MLLSECQPALLTPLNSDLALYKPTRVINCTGLRGLPNVDWCEDHKIETMRSNVLGVLNLVDTCFELGIHITQIGSACVFDRDLNSQDPPFTEEDKPNYDASWYSRTRLISENVRVVAKPFLSTFSLSFPLVISTLKNATNSHVKQSISHYPNLLLFRIRTPVGADLNVNNLITKLIKYDRLLSVPAVCAIPVDYWKYVFIHDWSRSTDVFPCHSPVVFCPICFPAHYSCQKRPKPASTTW